MTTLQDLRNNHKVFFNNAQRGEKYNIRNIAGVCYLFVTCYDQYLKDQVTRIWRGSSHTPDKELRFVATFYGKASKDRALKFAQNVKPTAQFTQEQIRKIELTYVK